MIPNVLADRYASAAMLEIFDPEHRVRLERRFWIEVMRAQHDAGLTLDPGVLEAHEAVVDDVDLESIRRREAESRHDVKARLDEFSALAGHQVAHRGMTSRDLTENVEGLQVAAALDLLDGRTRALLAALAERAAAEAATVMVGRTHNVAAQPVTLGKRFAMVAEEVLAAHDRLVDLRRRFAIRGLKGPVGSQTDLLDLLGSAEAVDAVEAQVSAAFGIGSRLQATGQVYPRSRDLDVVAAFAQLASGPANLANSIRLMAGHDLATEGFRAGQVGSSAMPHKMNTRSCERINGFMTILRGHLAMAASLAGDQWNEGDVSCSVVRRVVLPDSCFAIDGLLETTFSVLDGFGAHPAVIDNELERYLPFLATTALLMHAVKEGAGREAAHETIKTHAVATALSMRAEGGPGGRALIDALGDDPSFPGDREQVGRLIEDPSALLGRIDTQIASIVAEIGSRVAERPEAAAYRGGEIL